MELLKDKTIVVMGVANKWSIAWAIAEELRASGANLIFTYNRPGSGRNLEKLLLEEGYENPVTISCDVTKEGDVRRAFETVEKIAPKIHGVVHSIAHAKKDELSGRYADTSREGFLMAQEISVFSFVEVAREASRLMDEGGAMVTITYLGGERVIKNYNVMGVAKASLDASVKYLARDLGPRQIRVNAISSGPIKTLAAKGVGEFNKIAEIVELKSPMERMVRPREVGQSAVFLMSELSSGVTGEILHVDCGYNIISL